MKSRYYPEIVPRRAEFDAFSAIPIEIKPLITPVIRADAIVGDYALGSPDQVSKWVEH